MPLRSRMLLLIMLALAWPACASAQQTRTIGSIQGNGTRSPDVGRTVTTRGVVTQVTRNGRNFWLQDAGDGNPATSDGIFVAEAGRNERVRVPNVGDLVTITAQVDEQQFEAALPLTRLVEVQSLRIEARNNRLPAPVELRDLPNESLAEATRQWEALEGMLVTVGDAVAVSPTDGNGEFALLARADAQPGSGFFPQTGHLLTRSLGPNRVDYNPERIIIGDSVLRRPVDLRPGDGVRRVVGTVDYTFGSYKIQAGSLEATPRPLPPVPVSQRSNGRGNLVVTSMNVENLFDRRDDPGTDEGDSQPTAEELETKLRKLTLAIEQELALPDILVAVEVENEGILQTLGDRVNQAAGTSYVATSFPASDGRGIEVGLLWDEARVDLLDAYQMRGREVEQAFGRRSGDPGREPIVGVFRPVNAPNAPPLTVIGNHWKSKSSDDRLFGVNDPPRRPSEEQRKLQARAVRAFVDGLLRDDPQALVLVAGDLNDFAFGEPGEGADHPLAILGGTGNQPRLTDLVEREPEAERYTFVFEGNSQVLDHMLVSPALLERTRGQDILHFNAGFPAILSEDRRTPLRSSDHDPVEGRFQIE